MVIKIDLMKSYIKVELLFLTEALRTFGFSERIINMVYRLVGNNWYLILLNGQPKGILRSSRVLK